MHTITLATDGEYLLQERTWRAEAGLEYFLLKSYGVRVGYQFLRDQVGLTAGFGLRWRSRTKRMAIASIKMRPAARFTVGALTCAASSIAASIISI